MRVLFGSKDKISEELREGVLHAGMVLKRRDRSKPVSMIIGFYETACMAVVELALYSF